MLGMRIGYEVIKHDEGKSMGVIGYMLGCANRLCNKVGYYVL